MEDDPYAAPVFVPITVSSCQMQVLPELSCSGKLDRGGSGLGLCIFPCHFLCIFLPLHIVMLDFNKGKEVSRLTAFIVCFFFIIFSPPLQLSVQ